jgi:hypothetical protein
METCQELSLSAGIDRGADHCQNALVHALSSDSFVLSACIRPQIQRFNLGYQILPLYLYRHGQQIAGLRSVSLVDEADSLSNSGTEVAVIQAGQLAIGMRRPALF